MAGFPDTLWTGDDPSEVSLWMFFCSQKSVSRRKESGAGSSVQYLVVAYNGKEHDEEHVCMDG